MGSRRVDRDPRGFTRRADGRFCSGIGRRFVSVGSCPGTEVDETAVEGSAAEGRAEVEEDDEPGAATVGGPLALAVVGAAVVDALGGVSPLLLTSSLPVVVVDVDAGGASCRLAMTLKRRLADAVTGIDTSATEMIAIESSGAEATSKGAYARELSVSATEGALE
jgi:hypothetical protein